ncbi:MAG: hypothetical protein ACTS22_07685 [Phycisphaerales bacterium]
MQLQGPTPDQVPPLPAAPLLEVWTLEQPLPAALGVALVAGAVAVASARRGRRVSAWVAAIVGLGLSAGLLVAAAVIDTPRELLRERSGQLARAAAAGDAATAASLLDEAVAVRQPDFRFPSIERTGRDAVLREIEALASLRAVASVDVLETRAAIDAQRVGRSHIRVRALNGDGGWIGHSWWEIDWVRRDGDWLAYEITPLWVQFN